MAEEDRVSAFIDASVFFAACDSPTGAARELIRYAFRQELTLVISEFALGETERNLRAERPQALPMFFVFRDTVPFEIVEPTKEDILALRSKVAFKDAPIFAAALKADVDCLVSYDRKHMIRLRDDLKKALGLTILLPGELLQQLRQGTGDP